VFERRFMPFNRVGYPGLVSYDMFEKNVQIPQGQVRSFPGFLWKLCS